MYHVTCSEGRREGRQRYIVVVAVVAVMVVVVVVVVIVVVVVVVFIVVVQMEDTYHMRLKAPAIKVSMVLASMTSWLMSF